MKMSKTSTILTVAGTLLLAVSAQAASFKAAVHSSNGNAVHSSNGNCVITKWDSASACSNIVGGVDYELRTVYFDFNGASLTPAAKTKLDALVKALKTSGAKEVRIVGFADEIGTAKYNSALSKKRAVAVSSYLKKKGVKVNKGKFEVKGLGATDSKSSCSEAKGNELKACLWRDRRVEVEVVN